MNKSQAKWDRLFEWVEATMNGRMKWRERQGRGRPAWFMDVEVGDRTVPLYWRGYRGDLPGGKAGIYSHYPIEREAAVLKIMEAKGIPVPHVYGFCEDPKGILMERAPGSPDFHRIESEAEREAIAGEFMGILAKTHCIDASEFEEIGMPRPTTPDEQALGDIGLWEQVHREVVEEPAPFLECALQWLHRNVPDRPVRPVLIHGDTGPGNFLSENGRITAILDWEFAHLGDPMEDLALIRARDLCYPFGDMRRHFAQYAELSGNALDLKALRYYSVRAMLNTPLGLFPVVRHPHPRGDVPENLSWYVLYARVTAECLADAIGVKVEPPPTPEPTLTDRSPIFDAVLQNLREEQLPHVNDSYRQYRLHAAVRLLEYLRQAERIGPTLEAMELDDMGALLGFRPASLAEGNEALQKLVIESGPEKDKELVRYFYRRIMREQAMLYPAMEDMRWSALTPIE